MRPFREWFETEPDGSYRPISDRPLPYQYAAGVVWWCERLGWAVRSAYVEFRRGMDHDWKTRRWVRLRELDKTHRHGCQIPAEVWIRPLDGRDEVERDPRLAGQEFMGETNAWGGGCCASDALVVVADTLEMLAHDIAMGYVPAGGKVTIAIDTTPHPYEQP